MEISLKCGELYRKTAQRKRLNRDSSTVLLKIDRARLFTGVNMDPNLRVALVEAHCLPEKRKDWFQPASSNDDPLKQWMLTWNMWAQVKMLAAVMLDNLIDQVFAKGGIDLTKNLKDTKDNSMSRFNNYKTK
jgi:hypothetical protein